MEILEKFFEKDKDTTLGFECSLPSNPITQFFETRIQEMEKDDVNEQKD